jgi:predicted branched-subunit amino acid permease
MISVFSVVGSAIIPLFPESVKTSFKFIQPALFASVYASMFPKDLLAAVLTLLGSYAAFVYLPPLGLPKVYMMLVTVGLGMIAGYFSFRLKHK